MFFLQNTGLAEDHVDPDDDIDPYYVGFGTNAGNYDDEANIGNTEVDDDDDVDDDHDGDDEDEAVAGSIQ